MTTTIYLSIWEDWRTLFFALCYTAIGILVSVVLPHPILRLQLFCALSSRSSKVRSVFRIAEFAQGYDGTLRTVEWYFWVFDALPLLLAIAVYCFVWPPCFLRQDARYFADWPASGYNMQRLPTGSPTTETAFLRHRTEEYKV